MEIITPINIDLINSETVPVVNIKQGDSGRGVLVTLEENGTARELKNETVRICGKRADGIMLYGDCTIKDGKVLAVFPRSMTEIPCDLQMELEVTSGEETVSTPIAHVRVLKSNMDLKAIESSDEFRALEEALERVETIESEFAQMETKVDDFLNGIHWKRYRIVVEEEAYKITVDAPGCKKESWMLAMRNQDVGNNIVNAFCTENDKLTIRMKDKINPNDILVFSVIWG